MKSLLEALESIKPKDACFSLDMYVYPAQIKILNNGIPVAGITIQQMNGIYPIYSIVRSQVYEIPACVEEFLQKITTIKLPGIYFIAA